MRNKITSMSLGENSSSLKNYLAPIVAIIVLLGFAWFVYYMLGLKNTEEKEWMRAVYLFTGVEAIAFAAAGFFFGREVHRERAEKAEQNADEASNRATNAESRATDAQRRGKDLAEYIKAKVEGQRSKGDIYGALGGGETVQITQKDFEELEAIANRLFP